MSNTVKERLTQYLKLKKISKTSFGKAIGVSNSFVSSMRKSIAPDKIQSIALNYPDLNIEWLLTGEGAMLKNQSGHTVVTGDVSGNGNNIVAGNHNVLRDVEARYAPNPKSEVDEVVDAEPVEIKETAILFPEVLSAEDVDIKKGLNDGTLDVPVKPTQDVLPPHHAKVYPENDEMAPDIEANDPVFVRFLASKRDYISGRVYFVDLDNGSVVRWVVREGADHIRLVSMKDEEVVPLSRVRSISEVVAITKRPKTLPKDRSTFAEAMAKKDGQLNAMMQHQERMLDQQSRLIGIIEEQTKR